MNICVELRSSPEGIIYLSIDETEYEAQTMGRKAPKFVVPLITKLCCGRVHARLRQCFHFGN